MSRLKRFCTLEERFPAEMRVFFMKPSDSSFVEEEVIVERIVLVFCSGTLLSVCVYSDNYRVVRRWDCVWRPGSDGRGGPCS